MFVMMIEDLQIIETLPIATSSTQIDERILSIIDLAQRNPELENRKVAETIVDVIGYVSYDERMSIECEQVVLKWIDQVFDESNLECVDAIATIYANFCSEEAFQNLRSRIISTNNKVAKSLLNEAYDEFEKQT